MTYDERESAYQIHRNTESRSPQSVHIDGCFYCGGQHPSDCCQDREAQDEYWDD